MPFCQTDFLFQSKIKGPAIGYAGQVITPGLVEQGLCQYFCVSCIKPGNPGTYRHHKNNDDTLHHFQKLRLQLTARELVIIQSHANEYTDYQHHSK